MSKPSIENQDDPVREFIRPKGNYSLSQMTSYKDSLCSYIYSCLRFMSPLLSNTHVIIVEDWEKAPSIAWTDGKLVYICGSFFDLNFAEGAAVIYHELYHLALRHVPRLKNLLDAPYMVENDMMIAKSTTQEYFNISVDFIVNRSIQDIIEFQRSSSINEYLSLPKPMVDLITKVREMLGKAKELKIIDKATTEQELSSEDLYYILLKTQIKDKGVTKSFISGISNDLDSSGENSPGSGQEEGDGEGSESKQITDLISTSPQDLQDKVWENKLRQSMSQLTSRGFTPSNELRRFTEDTPPARVRWEVILKTYINKFCLPETEENWSTISRRFISNYAAFEYGLSGSIYPPCPQPGIRPKKGVKKIGIVTDTSGSMPDSIFQFIFAEVKDIIQKYGNEVVWIDADTAVAQIQYFNRHNIPKKYQAKGGGGTDFRPACLQLEKEKVDVAIYFTDGYGSFPENKLKSTILWVIMNSEVTPPWGKTLYLADKDFN